MGSTLVAFPASGQLEHG